MRRVKKRIFAGAVCEQIVYNVGDRGNVKKAKPKIRFNNDEERAEHRKKIALRRFIRKVNASFTPMGYFATLTMSKEYECHDYDDARTIRRNYARRLQYKYPEAKIIIVMGRGRSTARIHFHMFIEGAPEKYIKDCWKEGTVVRFDHLREHNRTPDGTDLGADFTAVATYCFEHWDEEQGGHCAYCSRTLEQPEEEDPTVCVREYTPEHPPITPKGYKFVSCTWNRYGYMIFKYVKEPGKEKRQRKRADN